MENWELNPIRGLSRVFRKKLSDALPFAMVYCKFPWFAELLGALRFEPQWH
jgi:hypothetical protein